ncbi:hypothetical protein GCM10023149_30700 [Mucilaginibacter gynuensis]|uniref:Integral membrane protein n=1 Tax=Mucilaginibacter gynuensis TaxID=1302236 RepID=A0ABP8GMZ6_9SPHI
MIIHKPISPKAHAMIDYVLVGALLVVPSLLKFHKKARRLYIAEAAVLLPYVALTKQPLSLKGIIPMETHGRIDPFNIAQFALQTFYKRVRRNRSSLIFNIAFTALAGITVLLTNYDAKTSR